MDADFWLTGEGNINHPDNDYLENEDFNSDNISECLDYAKEFDDFEPLENAITNQETIIEKAVSEIDYFISMARNGKNVSMHNRLYNLKCLLKSNQKK